MKVDLKTKIANAPLSVIVATRHNQLIYLREGMKKIFRCSSDCLAVIKTLGMEAKKLMKENKLPEKRWNQLSSIGFPPSESIATISKATLIDLTCPN